MAMKLDMSKVYDRIDWRYLKWIMAKMNFPPKVIKLTMRCVKSVSFQVLINRNPTRSFFP